MIHNEKITWAIQRTNITSAFQMNFHNFSTNFCWIIRWLCNNDNYDVHRVSFGWDFVQQGSFEELLKQPLVRVVCRSSRDPFSPNFLTWIYINIPIYMYFVVPRASNFLHSSLWGGKTRGAWFARVGLARAGVLAGNVNERWGDSPCSEIYYAMYSICIQVHMYLRT